jgi:hypothetical protein
VLVRCRTSDEGEAWPAARDIRESRSGRSPAFPQWSNTSPRTAARTSSGQAPARTRARNLYLSGRESSRLTSPPTVFLSVQCSHGKHY